MKKEEEGRKVGKEGCERMRRGGEGRRHAEGERGRESRGHTEGRRSGRRGKKEQLRRGNYRMED